MKPVFFTFTLLLLYYSWLRIGQQEIKNNLKANTLTKADYKFLTRVLSDDGYADFFYAQTLYHKFHEEKKALLLMDKAILKNKSPKEIRKLANYYIKKQNYERAEDLLQYNIYNEPYRFNPRMDLAKLYRKTNQSEKLIAILKDIIALPVKIPSKEVEIIKRSAKQQLSEVETDY